MQVIRESRIKGQFAGWDATKTVELEDGSKWKLVRSVYRYKPMFRPKAKILMAGSKTYMVVDGMSDDQQQVNQIF